MYNLRQTVEEGGGEDDKEEQEEGGDKKYGMYGDAALHVLLKLNSLLTPPLFPSPNISEFPLNAKYDTDTDPPSRWQIWIPPPPTYVNRVTLGPPLY